MLFYANAHFPAQFSLYCFIVITFLKIIFLFFGVMFIIITTANIISSILLERESRMRGSVLLLILALTIVSNIR